MIIKKYLPVLIIYLVFGFSLLLFDFRSIFIEQIKLFFPYICVLALVLTFFTAGFLRIFLFLSVVIIYILANFNLPKHEFLADQAGNKFKIEISDKIQLTIDGSEECTKASYSTICADQITKLPYEFEVDLSCKIEAYKYKDLEIFLINREPKSDTSVIYEQRVCLRRLASLLRRQNPKALVFGNFGAFANAASVRLLSSSVKLEQVLSWNDIVDQFFRLNPPGYIFVEKVRLTDYKSANGIYEFELS